MESRRTGAMVESPETNASPAPSSPSSEAGGRYGWLATPAIVVLVVVCCAGPLLVGAVVATGAATWLAAHGYVIGAAVLLVVAAAFMWRIRARLSRG